MSPRRYALLFAAVAATLPAVSRAQVLINDNFDDGLGASRWTFVAREQNIDPAVATPDATVNFAFDYTAVTYESNHGTVGTTSGTHGDNILIPAAPGGGSKIGVQIHVNDTKPAVNNIVQAVLMPAAFGVTGDFTMKADLFLNYNAPGAGSGSTESYMIGLNNDGVNVAGDDFTTLSIPANFSAKGYAFEGSSDGDNGGDYRVYDRRYGGQATPTDPTIDDGPRFSKFNSTWTGTTREPFIDATGTYSGVQILPEEANGGAGNGGTVPYRGFTNSNTYFRDELFPTDGYTDATHSVTNPNGYEAAGVVGKHWVTLQVEQHGNIALYTANGRIINHLFLPSNSTATGKPELGITDQTSGEPDDTTDSYALYDNINITAVTPGTVNTISDAYPRFNAGGTVTINGAATVNGLQLDTTPTTLAGTGAITMGTAVAGSNYAAIWSGGGAQVVSKPVSFQSDSAVFVEAATDTLTLSSVTTNPAYDFSVAGKGKLIMPAGFNTKSFNVERLGNVKISTAGLSKTNLFWLEGVPALTATLPLSATLSQFDFGRSVVAIDYSGAASVATPAVPLSPLTLIQLYLNNGFAVDGSGNPQWTGRGLVTSAAEVQGALFADPANKYTIRVFEASAMGIGAVTAWGSNGLTIDTSTVLFGFDLKTDTNFDQTINFNDLLMLAQNYGMTVDNSGGMSWSKGDSNGDGVVNFDDLLALAQVYGTTVSGESLGTITGTFAGDWALAQSMVPEPTSLAAIGIGALSLLGRRRKAR